MTPQGPCNQKRDGLLYNIFCVEVNKNGGLTQLNLFIEEVSAGFKVLKMLRRN